MMRKATLIALLLLAVLGAAVGQTPDSKQKKTQAQKMAKLAEPWPDADALAKRQKDAENRALFQSTGPLAFTLESDFTTVNKDRDPNSTKLYAATLKIPGKDGQVQSVDLKIGARGHLRRTEIVCEFVPLRLEFTKEAVAETPLQGSATSLKLVTHCRNAKDHEQYVLREFLAYKLSNIVIPQSFRARLSKVTYVNSKTGKELITRYGMLLEDEGDVARRLGGRTVALQRTAFTDLNLETLDRMMVQEYMLGNTDYSIFGLHNVVLVQKPDRTLYPVAYDFDLSGLVHAPYAVPAPALGIKTVLDRLYRGACRSADQLEPTLAAYRAKKAELLAAPDSIPDLNSDSRAEVKAYLNDFFSTIERPASVKRAFIDGCKRTTM